MTVIYWTTYLDEFEKQCTEYLETETRELTISELFKPTHYQSMCLEFEIPITSEIFYKKLGKHPEAVQVFKKLGFEAVPESAPRMYRLTKT